MKFWGVTKGPEPARGGVNFAIFEVRTSFWPLSSLRGSVPAHIWPVPACIYPPPFYRAPIEEMRAPIEEIGVCIAFLRGNRGLYSGFQ